MRAIFRYNPENLDALLQIGYGKAKNERNHIKAVGTLPGGTNLVGWNYPDRDDLDNWNFDAPSHNDIENTYAILDISYYLGRFTLKSITGFDDGEGDYLQDSDASPINVLNRHVNLAETEQFTQELQLQYSDENLDAVAGLYYFKEDYDYFLFLSSLDLRVRLACPGCSPTRARTRPMRHSRKALMHCPTGFAPRQVSDTPMTK